MVRHESWPSILDKAVMDAMKTPFKWGEHDCAIWTAKVVDAMCGTSNADDFKSEYQTEMGAAKVILRHGDIEGLADSILPRVDIKYAKRGDVVSVMTDKGLALGVIVGNSAAVASKQGLCFTTKYVSAWGVG